MSFSKAFSAARKAGKKTFTYNGKKYTTKMKGEAKKAPTPKAKPKATKKEPIAEARSRKPIPKPKPRSTAVRASKRSIDDMPVDVGRGRNVPRRKPTTPGQKAKVARFGSTVVNETTRGRAATTRKAAQKRSSQAPAGTPRPKPQRVAKIGNTVVRENRRGAAATTRKGTQKRPSNTGGRSASNSGSTLARYKRRQRDNK